MALGPANFAPGRHLKDGEGLIARGPGHKPFAVRGEPSVERAVQGHLDRLTRLISAREIAFLSALPVPEGNAPVAPAHGQGFAVGREVQVTHAGFGGGERLEFLARSNFPKDDPAAVVRRERLAVR